MQNRNFHQQQQQEALELMYGCRLVVDRLLRYNDRTSAKITAHTARGPQERTRHVIALTQSSFHLQKQIVVARSDSKIDMFCYRFISKV